MKLAEGEQESGSGWLKQHSHPWFIGATCDIYPRPWKREYQDNRDTKDLSDHWWEFNSNIVIEMGVNNVNAQSKSPLGPKYPLFSFKNEFPRILFLFLIPKAHRVTPQDGDRQQVLWNASRIRTWAVYKSLEIMMHDLDAEEFSEMWGWHLLGSETAVTTLSVPQWRWTVVDRAGPFQQPFTGRNQNWKHLKTPRRVTWPPVYFITEYFMAPSPPSQEPQLPSLNVDCEQLRLSAFPPTWFHCHHASVSGCSDQRDTSCT